MQYDYFIKSLNENGRTIDRFVMLPAALQADEMTPFMTQLQTVVSMPLDSTAQTSFKLRYFRNDGRIYPVLVILSSKYGVWRLGFSPTQEGIKEAQNTFAGIQVLVKRYRDQKQLKLAHAVRSLERVSAAEVARETTASVVNGSPIKTSESKTSERAANQDGSNVVRLAARNPEKQRQIEPGQPPQKLAHPANAQQPKKTTASKNSPKKKGGSYLLYGIVSGAILSGALFAERALANEQPDLISVIPMPEIVAVPTLPEGELCETGYL